MLDLCPLGFADPTPLHPQPSPVFVLPARTGSWSQEVLTVTLPVFGKYSAHRTPSKDRNSAWKHLQNAFEQQAASP